jgi:hypothetical protein
MNDREREERAVWKLHQAGECVRRQAGRYLLTTPESVTELHDLTQVAAFADVVYGDHWTGARSRRARRRPAPIYIMVAANGRPALRQGALRQWHHTSSSVPAPQELLRLIGKLTHNLSRALHLLDPVDRFTGPVWHGLNRSRHARVDVERLKALY